MAMPYIILSFNNINYKRYILDIVYIEVFNKNCFFYLKNLKEPMVVTGSLSYYAGLLADCDFMQINRSCIINMCEVDHYGKGKTPDVVMHHFPAAKLHITEEYLPAFKAFFRS